jgi:hypothetical protein
MISKSTFSINLHLKEVERKMGFICWKLSKIRKLNHARLNTNLFLTFAMPLYRLAATMYQSLTKFDK